ncbi:MAG: hypothetical protein ABI193_14280 [Minicystis sp.]
MAGCSLWVSAELSDKPGGADGGPGGAGGMSGTTTASGMGGMGATSGAGGLGGSNNTTQSSSSGELVCPKGSADCDQDAANGCEVDLQTSKENCGQCEHKCAKKDTCKGGQCD